MKNIIITGTSRGIGLELALQFAQKGHHVLALSRNIAPQLTGIDNITNLSVDLTKEEDYLSIIGFISSNWKQVDAIVHNAGALLNQPFSEIKLADFKRIYDINVFGVAQLTQICLPFLQKGSHVVTISSMGGIQGSMKFPGLAAYSSSKGAVITLSELLAEEYKDQGIAFNVLALGAVQTEMLEEAFPGYQAPTTPKEMAAYILNFTLEGNTYFNGKILQVSSTTP